MDLQQHGTRRYGPSSALLASSVELGWTGLSVELRRHERCEAPPVIPPSVEICLVIDGNADGLVQRSVAGHHQEARARTGAIWLSPAGVEKDIAISAPIPETMHLYLPPASFERLRDDFNLPTGTAYSIAHAAGIEDEIINQIGRSILAELRSETAAGRMFVETASLTLAARILQHYGGNGELRRAEVDVSGFDAARLRRVLDYLEANAMGDVSLDDLAAVAGYSSFHFARKFKQATGVSPHLYLSRVRIEKAMAELALGKVPIAQIALNASFSSQSSFTRAFHRVTGMTPKDYRRRRAN